ncbi:MAG: hypothetical protein VYA86_06725 [Candidatus Thermoplasmatota archaeon]|nr:hypothetical protein [Candidatus Thermoplasmatota archaeon]
MSIIDKIFGKNEDDVADEQAISRLENLATHSIDVATIPLDAAPIEEDAWTLAPSPTRARIGATGLEVADSVAQDSSGKQVNFDTKEIEDKMDSRFDRIEATMSMLDARLTQLKDIAGTPYTIPTDKLITMDTEEEEDEGVTEDEESDIESEVRDVQQSDVNLLDLYESRIAELNPFLNQRPGALTENLPITTSEIVALLLDNLSSTNATSFVEKAAASGMITTGECSVLKGLIDLADPAINENATEHLPHRELLMFNAMIGAWRQANAPPEGA